MESLNQILNIPEEDVKIIKLLGQGARSNVYQVEKNGAKYAMKLLIKKTEQNQNLLKYEFDIISQLYNLQMTEQTYCTLSQLVQPIYTLQDINTSIIKQLIPKVEGYNIQYHYYFMPVYQKIQLKMLNDQEAEKLKHQLLIHYFLLKQLGVHHNDYSQYNIMKTENNNFVVIDYEECVPIDEEPPYPGSARYSLVPINNICTIGIILYEIYNTLPWDSEKWPDNIHKIQNGMLKDVQKHFKTNDDVILHLLQTKDKEISVLH